MEPRTGKQRQAHRLQFLTRVTTTWPVVPQQFPWRLSKHIDDPAFTPREI